MLRLGIACVAALGVVALLGGVARAQTPPGYVPQRFGSFNPVGPAPLSPYLNLARDRAGNALPAVDYYLGTIPERERRANAAYFNSAINTLDREVVNPTEAEQFFPTLAATGHPASFGNTGGYFNNQSPVSRRAALGPAGLRGAYTPTQPRQGY